MYGCCNPHRQSCLTVGIRNRQVGVANELGAANELIGVNSPRGNLQGWSDICYLAAEGQEVCMYVVEVGRYLR